MPAWELELRAKFPALRLATYLDAAATGPLAFEVARAGFGVYETLLQSGGAEWERQFAEVEQSRALLAALIGCDADELAFTRNTSHSVSLVAEMLWAEGKRTVVALEEEFPSSTLPFLHRGFDVRFVPPVDGRYRLEDVESALAGRDVLVASHVLFKTGFAVDTAAYGRLAKAAGAAFLLCVTQSLGALQVDFAASGADFLVGTSHKWLCGGFGAGLLAVKAHRHGRTRWPLVGWLSQRQPEAMRNDLLDLDPRPRAMEAGCQPIPVLLAAGAAARLWLETGPERIETRVRSLTALLRERLRDAGFAVPSHAPEETSGITVVPVADAHQTIDRLRAANVIATPRGNGVRLSVHAFNDVRDIERGVEALLQAKA
ncbi:MAG: hypothetical protein RL199_1773 [Pseudomonadota bacterium]|jgi:selenocysteine lyase/cysteine desulfurase